MTISLPAGLIDSLLWCEEKGIGFHPRPPMAYDGSYFEHYRELDASPVGAALTQARLDMVRRHFDGPPLDVGIGGGRFVTESSGCGYDVNPDAIHWLTAQGRYRNPYFSKPVALCFWDSLEHIPNPSEIVDQATEWVFVSMPIYTGVEDVLTSKHYKPGEHLWYWTRWGLIRWFDERGFTVVESNSLESTLGRSGIMSFAFKRKG